jgi:hypothetical protein
MNKLSSKRRRSFTWAWTLGIALAVPLLLHAPAARAQFTFPESCRVGFDDPSALAAQEPDSDFTFATEYRSKDARSCTNVPCKLLRVICLKGTQVVVTPTKYHELHLEYEDPTIDCIDSKNDGRFGRKDASGKCVAITDNIFEPRQLSTHLKDELLSIQVLDEETGTIALPFDATAINVDIFGGGSIKYRYRKAGKLSGWTTLKNNGTHAITKPTGITELQITGVIPKAGTAGSVTLGFIDLVRHTRLPPDLLSGQ